MAVPTVPRRAPSRTVVGVLLALLSLSALVFPLAVQLAHRHGPGESADDPHGGWTLRLLDHQHTTPHFEAAETVWHPVCALCARLMPVASELALRPRPGSFLAADGAPAPAMAAALVSTLRGPARPRGPPRV